MKSRVLGVFDVLETPDQKREFALGLMTDEKLLGEFGALEVKSISETLFNKALSEGKRKTIDDKMAQTRMEGLLDDDLASVEATGAGLDPEESGLSADLVTGVLGPEKLMAWQEGRRKAMLAYQATAGMEIDSEADILTRLDTLMPEPGQPGFADQEAVFNRAAKRAEQLLKERAKDPLGAASGAGLIELQPIDPSSADTLDASLLERKRQAQAVSTAWDQPVPLFRPDEVKSLKSMTKSTDPVVLDGVMTQIDFMASETSLQAAEADFGADAIERLQDWRGRVRHMTPDEAQSWLKDRENPDWKKRVEPLVNEGRRKAREVPVEDIVSTLDPNWVRDVAAPVDTDSLRQLQVDYEHLVGDRYAVTRDMTTARDQASEMLKRTWGVTYSFGEGGGRLMAYPPEAQYPSVGGSHDWISEDTAKLAKQFGADPENLSLVPDGKTKAAIDRGERPGYLVSTRDPETGLDELAVDDKGRPLRQFFDPQPYIDKLAREAAAKRDGMNEPWLVINERSAIGPLYMPWRPATPADMRDRQRRIDEIMAQRRSAN